MDIDASPDAPRKTPTPPTRDPLIRYSVYAALGCAAVCMIFTLLYVFSYSLDSTLSFERHFDAYLAAGNTANLPTVLGLHNAQNRMFLQSCGMVAGIFFAFLGLALFLVGIQGTVDVTGEVRDYSANLRRLAPGGIILLASMIFVGVSAMHPIDFTLAPTPSATILTPTADTTPAPATTPATAAPTTPSQAQPTPATPQPARVVPQSAPAATTQPPAILLAQPTSQPATTTTAQTTPTPAPVKRPAPRLTVVNQKAPTPAPPTEHRFQP